MDLPADGSFMFLKKIVYNLPIYCIYTTVNNFYLPKTNRFFIFKLEYFYPFLHTKKCIMDSTFFQ